MTALRPFCMRGGEGGWGGNVREMEGDGGEMYTGVGCP